MAAPSSSKRKRKACMPVGARPSPSVSRAVRRSACRAISTPSPRRKPPTWGGPMLSKAEARQGILSIPGTDERLWFNQPSVFVHDRFLAKTHHKEDAVTLQVGSMEMRDMMLEAEPALFYITDHYRKFPFVLVRLSALTKTVLKEMLVGRAAQLAAMPVKKARAKKKALEKSGKKIAPVKRARKT